MTKDKKETWEKIYLEHSPQIDTKILLDNLKKEFTKEYNRIKNDFSQVSYTDNHQTIINNFINDIPEKFENIKIKIRPYKEFFFSCIITDEEVDFLANREHNLWVKNMEDSGWQYDEFFNPENKTTPFINDYLELSSERRRFYRELIYTIQIIFVNSGYEIIKEDEQEFINKEVLEDVAKAIHAQYKIALSEISDKEDSIYEKLYIVNEYNRKYYTKEYNELPDEIKKSNIDSAYHISTKMLSIGYKIENVNEDAEAILLSVSETDIETMAKLEHERWAWEKRLQGYIYSPTRNDKEKKHNCLLPYNELPELEKEKDRNQVKLYPDLLKDLNYNVIPLTNEQKDNISYIKQPQKTLSKSLIHIEKTIDILNKSVFKNETDTFKEQIEHHLSSAIKFITEIGKSIDVAYGVQQNILPKKIFLRSCLPDSFILFKPKDVLSGDFYFVSKIEDSVIVAVADCTGHGISGAMLSMVFSSYLDQAVNDKQITNPSDIIYYVYKKLIHFMKRHGKNKFNGHGMEISICNINMKTKTLLFAGINRPLFLYKANKFEKVIPQKNKTGEGYEDVIKNIVPSQELKLEKGDLMYMFSDGYQDQLGGLKYTKFKIKYFRELLDEIHTKPLLEQHEILNRKLEEWKNADKNYVVEQSDDIIVLGIKV